MNHNSAMTGSPALAGDNGGAYAVVAISTMRGEILRLRYALTEVKFENALRKLARANGSVPPAIHRWPRARNGLLEIPSINPLKRNVVALRFQIELWRLAYQEHKAGFDPNQPRVPRGEAGGGQWTDGGANGGEAKQPDASEGDRAPLRITIHPRPKDDGGSNGGGSGSDGDIGDPPDIPEEGPLTTQAVNDFAKAAAWWLAKATAREIINPTVGTFINAIEAAYWLHKVYPYIRAYLDPPKTLDELQRTVSNRARGYDTHHIVEQGPARRSGFPRSLIDAAENLVRIPTLKHWEINAWYGRSNKDFGGLSPREYLRGKDWAERVRVGRIALSRYGVLIP